MIKAKRKPLKELMDCLAPYGSALIVGCGGCVSVCMAGGQPEVENLKSELSYLSGQGKTGQAKKKVKFSGYTVERQCNAQFLSGLDQIVGGVDCLLSMACGAGVQFLAERYAYLPVFPAVNTEFIGIDRAPGWYEEKCRACGECVLAYTGGICPVTRCAKSLFNGPCGGTDDGDCEVARGIPCAWHDIYERLSAQDRLDSILNIKPPMKWQNQVQRTLIQTGFESRYNIQEH